LNAARTYTLPGFDGAALAVHEVGDEHARPVMLIHGLFSNAETNWIKYGHAAQLAEAGFRVIMPDLRAHGLSAAPHDPAAYPEGVLSKDIIALIEALQLEDYDLGGFSLGARTVAALISQDAVRPRQALIAGMGLEGLSAWSQRRNFFIEAIDKRETIKRDDPHFMAVMFMKTMKIDPVAARLLLEAGNRVDIDALCASDIPAAIICGVDDQDNGSAKALADALADTLYYEIPGTHMSCITRPELGQAMVDFLKA